MDLKPKLDFNQILEKNKHKIYRICKIYAVSPIEPQDLFQEVIFQIWKSLKTFKNKSSIDTWIYRITLNVCMSSKIRFDKKNMKTDRFESIHITQIVAEKEGFIDERFKHLKACITKLNETDTSLIILYLDDLTYREIALITGLTENHVAVKMKRIRKKLFGCISKKID